MVHVSEDVGVHVYVRRLATMDEPLELNKYDMQHDLSKLPKWPEPSVPKTRHELWSTHGPEWEMCKREDARTWGFRMCMAASPVDCDRVYFWKH
jgi:hypothetical protein